MLDSKSKLFSKLSIGTKLINKKSLSRTTTLKKTHIGTFLF